MARLPRPHVDLATDLAVILRQLGEPDADRIIATAREQRCLGDARNRCFARLRSVLRDRLELHHDPALVNRRRYVRDGKTHYDPPANDPEHLVYLPEADHDVRTRVRGARGQLSDLGLRRKAKRAEKRAKRVKRKWASRPLRSAGRWPKRQMVPR